MKRYDEPRKLGPIEALLTAIFGVGGGIFIALFMFVQLRSAWLDGFVGLGRGGDFDYESEPLSYIVAMSALYPTAIVGGAALAIVSWVVLMRHRKALQRASRRRG
jgi:hypothetical protein